LPALLRSSPPGLASWGHHPGFASIIPPRMDSSVTLIIHDAFPFRNKRHRFGRANHHNTLVPGHAGTCLAHVRTANPTLQLRRSARVKHSTRPNTQAFRGRYAPHAGAACDFVFAHAATVKEQFPTSQSPSDRLARARLRPKSWRGANPRLGDLLLGQSRPPARPDFPREAFPGSRRSWLRADELEPLVPLLGTIPRLRARY
jgi:hypothetical protein